jgi:hypothetical protein
MMTDVIAQPVERELGPVPEIPVVETDRDRFTQNRERVTAALRLQGDRQIMGALRNYSGGVCFVGLAAEVIE